MVITGFDTGMARRRYDEIERTLLTRGKIRLDIRLRDPTVIQPAFQVRTRGNSTRAIVENSHSQRHCTARLNLPATLPRR